VIKEELEKAGVKKKEIDPKELHRQKEILNMEVKRENVIKTLVKPFFEYETQDYHYFYVSRYVNILAHAVPYKDLRDHLFPRRFYNRQLGSI
jgi:hypothetical protein